jgi:hypothetical protein
MVCRQPDAAAGQGNGQKYVVSSGICLTPTRRITARLLMTVPERPTESAPPVRNPVNGQPDLLLFMVEHDLRDLSAPQRSSAHHSLAEAVRRAVRRGIRIRYVQCILVPEESRCLCLFEAAGADLVRNVNDIAQFPLARVVAVLSSVHPGTAPSYQPTTGENTSNGRH